MFNLVNFWWILHKICLIFQNETIFSRNCQILTINPNFSTKHHNLAINFFYSATVQPCLLILQKLFSKLPKNLPNFLEKLHNTFRKLESKKIFFSITFLPLHLQHTYRNNSIVMSLYHACLLLYSLLQDTLIKYSIKWQIYSNN